MEAYTFTFYVLIHIKTRSRLLLFFFLNIILFTIEILQDDEFWGVVIDIHNINGHSPYKQVNNVSLIFIALNTKGTGQYERGDGKIHKM